MQSHTLRGLDCLDSDVLILICEHVHELSNLALCALSSTCRLLRQVAMPIIFCTFRVRPWRYLRALPETIVPHIKYVTPYV
ncbi:hypothetical protein BD413DRAFT_589387 [Trametes elegans]|nr:hypothetical protein BD413DRAFT_589387 [Trametes elegans]